MHARLLILALVTVALLGFSWQASSASADKSVTITPTSGIVGTVVKAKLTGAPPNDPITVIFKGMNDPVLATGTTDANGNAEFTFTIPYAISGTYAIFFTDFKCSCQIATDFTVTVGVRTPTPTATATVPATPTRTATPMAATPTQPATPTAVRPTPIVPVLGTGGGPTDFGGNAGPGLFGAALLIIAAGFAFMNAGRLRNGQGPGNVAPAVVVAEPVAPPLPIPSVETADAPPVAQAERRRGSAVALVAGGVAVATAVALLFSRKR